MNMNEEHRTKLLRGLTTAALLAVLLIGVPVLLILGVGWPLPQGIPSGSRAMSAIRTGAIPPSLISKSISLILWILWFQMMAGIILEIWAHFHGRVAPQVAFIPKFIQSLSARIIGTALTIVFLIQHPGISMADNQDLLNPIAIEMDIDHKSSEKQPLVHTVQQSESLRTLAERYLGDPNRWTEVYVLNQGQSQAVGGSLSDPAQLQPGWELIMPVDAHLPVSAGPNSDENTLDNHLTSLQPAKPNYIKITVQSGDTLWKLAAHHLDDPERWIEIYNVNQDIIQNPNVILPGWELEIPVDGPQIEIPLFIEPLTEPFVESIEPSVPAVAYSTAKSTVVASINSSGEDERSTSVSPTIFTIGGLGLFASSLTWVLARLRRIQRRRLPSGRMPAAPSREAVQLEQQLQDASDPDIALFLDASLRVMSSRFAGHNPPEIIGAILDSNTVSVLLDAPAEAPYGFMASEDNKVWELSRREELEHLLIEAEGVSAPLPTLATIGTTSGREFLLNLEHVAALNLQGDPKAIEGLCAAMAIQLASSHLADDLNVVCVGFGQDLRVFERVEYVPDVTSAIERIAHQHRQNRALLGSHSPAADTRIGNSGDYWHPAVALVPEELTEEEAQDLLEVCGSSVCIVAHGLSGADWSGSLDENGLLVEPINLQLEPHGLSGAVVAAVAELATTAKDPRGVELEVSQVSHAEGLEVSTPVGKQVPIDIEVRVMGTVDVLGAAQPFTSRRALDLVTYLAFHPDGADRDQLRTHLWPPDDPPSESTFANTVSRARKALGADQNGKPYLPRVSPKGIYRLRPEVGTDVALFEALVSATRSDSSDRGRQQLQAALELVRGTPFTGGAGDMYRWADFGLRTQIDCMVDNVAHDLAQRCMEARDPEGARRAVMTSLRLVGVCEECYRWRLMAAAENPTEVRQVMSELLGLLKRENDQPEADDLISPDLLELYEQLMSGRMVFS
ncbi:MAG: LysM peptidoglycan-binding domain-containing protein [Acidimicrobiia bacterium]|nr:LysM peptidoglycan-binding domain-containing protein [Acidimicrobiia bacterium]